MAGHVVNSTPDDGLNVWKDIGVVACNVVDDGGGVAPWTRFGLVIVIMVDRGGGVALGTCSELAVHAGAAPAKQPHLCHVVVAVVVGSAGSGRSVSADHTQWW